MWNNPHLPEGKKKWPVSPTSQVSREYPCRVIIITGRSTNSASLLNFVLPLAAAVGRSGPSRWQQYEHETSNLHKRYLDTSSQILPVSETRQTLPLDIISPPVLGRQVSLESPICLRENNVGRTTRTTY